MSNIRRNDNITRNRVEDAARSIELSKGDKVFDSVENFKAEWPKVYNFIEKFINFCLEKYTDSVRNQVIDKITTSINQEIKEAKSKEERYEETVSTSEEKPSVGYTEVDRARAILRGVVRAIQEVPEFSDDQRKELLLGILDETKGYGVDVAYLQELSTTEEGEYAVLPRIIEDISKKFSQNQVTDAVNRFNNEQQLPSSVKEMGQIVDFLVSPGNRALIQSGSTGVDMKGIRGILEGIETALGNIINADSRKVEAEAQYRKELKSFLEAEKPTSIIPEGKRNQVLEAIEKNVSADTIVLMLQDFYKRDSGITLPTFSKFKPAVSLSRSSDENLETITNLSTKINAILNAIILNPKNQ